jgi:pimeloyl-ACP methyl ester carboxylesterase
MTAMRDVYRTEDGRAAVRHWCRSTLSSWPVPHERSEIVTSVGRTHLVRAGVGSVTVLFLPGTNFNASTSLDFLARLAEQHRVVGADVPGQPGLSEGSLAGEHVRAAHRLWVNEVIRSLHAEWMTLVARHTRPRVAPAPLTPEELSRWKHTHRVALSGERDCFLPVSKLGAAVRSQLAMDLEVIPGAGHLTSIEDPQRLTDAIATLVWPTT